jgi:hypothetical protein
MILMAHEYSYQVLVPLSSVRHIGALLEGLKIPSLREGNVGFLPGTFWAHKN